MLRNEIRMVSSQLQSAAPNTRRPNTFLAFPDSIIKQTVKTNDVIIHFFPFIFEV